MNDEQRVLRDHTLTAKQWNDLRRALENAEDDCRKIEEAIRQKSAEAKRLDSHPTRLSLRTEEEPARATNQGIGGKSSNYPKTPVRHSRPRSMRRQSQGGSHPDHRESAQARTRNFRAHLRPCARGSGGRYSCAQRATHRNLGGERADLPKRKAEPEAGEGACRAR